MLEFTSFVQSIGGVFAAIEHPTKHFERCLEYKIWKVDIKTKAKWKRTPLCTNATDSWAKNSHGCDHARRGEARVPTCAEGRGGLFTLTSIKD